MTGGDRGLTSLGLSECIQLTFAFFPKYGDPCSSTKTTQKGPNRTCAVYPLLIVVLIVVDLHLLAVLPLLGPHPGPSLPPTFPHTRMALAILPPTTPSSLSPLSQSVSLLPSFTQLIVFSQGKPVILATKTAQRYEGIVTSTSAEGDTAGVTLKDVKELSNLAAPPRDHIFIASTNIDTWSQAPPDLTPDSKLSFYPIWPTCLILCPAFRTDKEISQRKGPRERELQQWSAGSDGTALFDDDTFGPSNSSSWDQFAVNEKLFGVKTQFDENVYTTKLDRTAPDYKERERHAQRIANEIINVCCALPFRITV